MNTQLILNNSKIKGELYICDESVVMCVNTTTRHPLLFRGVCLSSPNKTLIGTNGLYFKDSYIPFKGTLILTV